MCFAANDRSDPKKASERYRAKALACERVGGDAKDYDTKCAWDELAIEWHCLASRSAHESSLDRELEYS